MEEKTKDKNNKTLPLIALAVAGWFAYKYWREEKQIESALGLPGLSGFYNPRLALPEPEVLGDAQRKIGALVESYSPVEFYRGGTVERKIIGISQ